MPRPVLSTLGALIFVAISMAIVFLLGMRAKWPLVVDTQRRINRAFINPRTMKSAGTPEAVASIVRHTGRTSGKPYATPVGPFLTDEGFVIALPYGTRPDWVRNVLAAGSATIVHEGRTYDVVDPQVVAMSKVEQFFPEGDRRGFRLFHVDEALRVNRLRGGA